ncbi:MAG: type II secretion system F family protein [Planctomycetia bacterium]|nr:type II secretion system F family protein [Planctomycetia bacterium]
MAYAVPVLMFFALFIGVWSFLSLVSQRNTRTQERLQRISRPQSLAEIEVPGKQSKEEKLQGVKKAMEDLGALLKPQTELEQSAIKIRLANAGFRSESASGIYQGLRVGSFVLFALMAVLFFYVLGLEFPVLPGYAWWTVFLALGLYLPNMVLWYLRSKRQEAIFLTLPDALDLLVVCVESGLGLDAAMRRVTEEMKDHAKVLCEELTLANFQLQMGRPRREVLHDLGVRTGVDDVRSLAAILIQADRFGSSIAQALRVQSDSMRTRRRQIAEEKAAKTAVQLIFPLVLFIFPGIFVVLVGPAAIIIVDELFKTMGAG